MSLPSTDERLLAAAKDLCSAVERNHTTKHQPMKYTVPWKAVVELEQAVAAAEVARRAFDVQAPQEAK